MHQCVVGREQQPAEHQTRRQDERADGGEVHFQQPGAERAQVASRPNHRTGRPIRNHQRGDGRQPQQRRAPTEGPHQRRINVATQQQQGVERAERYDEVVGAEPQSGQQHAG